MVGFGATYWVVRSTDTLWKSTDYGSTWNNDYIAQGVFSLYSIAISRTATAGGNIWTLGSDKKIYKYGLLTNIISNNNNPDKYVLEQNFPNPFNPVTIINFKIKDPGFTSLNIFDISGKKVLTLIEKEMEHGSYTVDLNTSSLSSGIYFYTLISGIFTETKKMILVK